MRMIPMLAVATALLGGTAFAADTMPADTTPMTPMAPMTAKMHRKMMHHPMHGTMHSSMHGSMMSEKEHGVVPLASDGRKIDNGATTPDANKAYMGGGVILEGAPGAPAPTPMATPRGQTPMGAVMR